MMTSYFRIGGVALEPPLGFFERVQAFISNFPGEDRRYSNLLTGNPIFVQAADRGIGHVVGRRRDRLWAMTGADVMRASGIDFDVRSDMPYSRLCREVRVRGAGLERVGRLLGAVCVPPRRNAAEREDLPAGALDGMPEGAVKADAPKIVLPDREEMKTPDGGVDPSLSRS